MSDKPFDPMKPVQTRDGRQARVIYHDAVGDYPIIALLRGFDGPEEPESYTSSGRCHKVGGPTLRDLVNVPEKPKTHPVQCSAVVDASGILRVRIVKPLAITGVPLINGVRFDITEDEDL